MTRVIVNIILILPVLAIGQIVQSNFSLPGSACINENIRLTNLSSNEASNYEWDFCSGELEAVHTSSMLTDAYGGYGTEVEMLEEGGKYYGFLIGRASGKLFRLDFGISLLNIPAITDLGGFGINSPHWRNIVVVKESGQFFGFIVDSNLNALYRIEFGTSIDNRPTSFQLVSGVTGLNSPFDIYMINKGANKFLFIANLGAEYLTRVRFNTFASNSPLVDKVSIPNSGGLSGVAFLQVGTEWFGAVTGVSSNVVARLSFGADLSSIYPMISLFTDLGIIAPAGISLAQDNGLHYFFVQSHRPSPDNFLFKVSFGDSFANPISQVAPLSEIGPSASGLWGFSAFKSKSQWIMLSTELNGSNVYRTIFPTECNLNPIYSNDFQPQITAIGDGLSSVSLTVANQDATAISTSQISISDLSAPEIAFSSENICGNLSFQPAVQVNNVASLSWSFGDGIFSTDFNPSHSYTAPGVYHATLAVTAVNGCHNFFRDTIKTYPPPSAYFFTPSELICTDGEQVFTNGTKDTFDGNLTYQWLVQDVPISTSRDLNYTFTSTEPQTIKLITSIPGCSSEATATITDIFEGPVVDFSATGNCEGEPIAFQTLISDPVESYSWDFGNGEVSTEENPVASYIDNADYAVKLTALSPNGCANSKTKTISINPKPQPDFSIKLPPQSCAESPTPFTNLTTIENGNVSSWTWNFGVAGAVSNQSEPSYTYSQPGNYEVSLTARSDRNCVNTIRETVSILPPPVADFTLTPFCANAPKQLIASGPSIQSYYWEIGTSYYTTPDPTHTFALPGTYPLKLVVTGTNNCQTTYNRTVTVPVPLQPNFSFTRNCVGYETAFTNLTTGSDPISAYSWNFANEGSAAIASPGFTFNTTGNKSVSLEVQTQSGCSYRSTRIIPVVAAPVANFAVSTTSGAIPLEVDFDNLSTNANQFSWNFGGAGTSSASDPSFTFNSVADYTVQLTAQNSQGCTASFSRVITAETPRPDVDIKRIVIGNNPDGSLKVVVTLENRGNTVIRNLPVEINISDNVKLTETIDEAIRPGILYNLVLDYGIQKQKSLQFLCAETELPGDLNPAGDRVCTELGEQVVMRVPFPNPANDLLFLEWIAPEDQVIEFHLTDLFGKTVLRSTVVSVAGLNTNSLNTGDLRAGIYNLTIKTSSSIQTHRILVTNQK